MRFFLISCLATVMAMAAVAADSGRDLRLVIEKQTVDVFDADGQLLQSLPFDGETPDADDRQDFAIWEDMDFDGFPDVRILFSQGMVNSYYDWWLWRPEEKKFVIYEESREIASPYFDQDAKIVYSYERGSAVANVQGRLVWRKGELVWLDQIVQDEADDGEHIVVRGYFRGLDGELKLVREETYLPEEMEECDHGVTDNFLPGFIVPVYFAEADSPLGICVMDAMFRIREVASPEDFFMSGNSEGRVAYRYDGTTMVEGKPCLAFSFGADNEEKFTAERHFAVDEAGNVYEMDIIAGGTYWKWEENGASWWGEYRRDGIALTIHNYRNGPFGLYFIFEFEIEGETVFDGVAPVRGRNAQYGALNFAISENNEAVTVMLEPESRADAEREKLVRLEGVYRTNSGSDVDSEAEAELPLYLRGNPSTGYFWSWTATGDGAVKEVRINYDQENEMPGSPATYTYIFAGEKEGDVTLRFVYSQSETEQPRDRVNTYHLRVLPDMRVMLVDMDEQIVGRPRPQW